MNKPKRISKRIGVLLLTVMTALVFFTYTPQVFSAEYVPFSAYGHVYDANRAPMPGVTVTFFNLEGQTFTSVVTDASGYYSEAGLWGAIDYRAQKNGWTFECTEPGVDYNGNLSNLDFVGSPVAYRVSGRVITASGQPVLQVTICFFDGRAQIPAQPANGTGKFSPAKTGDDGTWAKDGLSESVTVMPYKAGWTFSSRYVLVGSPSSVVNFTGTKNAQIASAVMLVPEKKPAAAVKQPAAVSPGQKTGPTPTKRVWRPVKGKETKTK